MIKGVLGLIGNRIGGGIGIRGKDVLGHQTGGSGYCCS
jgi:hypothetical protein